MRLLKFVLAALFAALAMAAGLVVSLCLVVFGFVISMSRRWFGPARRPYRGPYPRTRVPVRPGRPVPDDAIDVVVTEVPAAEAAVRRPE